MYNKIVCFARLYHVLLIKGEAMKRGISLFSVLAILILLLSACSEPQSSSSIMSQSNSLANSIMGSESPSDLPQNNDTAAPTQLYTLVIEGQNRMVALDQNGKLLLEEQVIRILSDVITGKPYLLVAERFKQETINSQYDIDYLPIPDETALFDLNGNILVEWQQGFAYAAAFEDYVLRQNQALRESTMDYLEGSSADCINYFTGEIVLDSMTHFNGIGNNQEVAVYNQYSNLGLVNRQMEKVKGWPWSEGYSIKSSWNNYYIAIAGTDFFGSQYQLLNQELNPILPGYYGYISIAFPNMDYLILSSDYWPDADSEKQNQSVSIFSIDGQLEYLPSVYTSITFFDGEIIQGYCDASAYPETNYAMPYVLMNKRGEMIIDEVFITSIPIVTDENGRFDFAIVQSGDTFTTYDGVGEVIATKDMPNYRLGYEVATGYFNCDSPSNGKEVFMNEHFEVIADFDTYVTYGLGCRDGYFINVLDPPPNQNRHNLIDIQGNILIENMENVYECYPDCLLVKWNGYIGMIDYAGNWLYQTPVS